MASYVSIIVEICDEKMANMWRKTVRIYGLLSFILFFLSGSCLFHGDDDRAKPQFNFQGKRLLLLIGLIFR